MLFLTGFMGSGKTTVGKRLADRLAVAFLDLDAEIVKKSGRSIAEIFATDGETVFRCLESEVLDKVCRQDTCAVIATGGGAVLDPHNRQKMREAGLIINLQVNYADVSQRLANDQSRPLLLQKDGAAVRALMAEREDAYADADLILSTAAKSPVQIVNEIQEWLLS